MVTYHADSMPRENSPSFSVRGRDQQRHANSIGREEQLTPEEAYSGARRAPTARGTPAPNTAPSPDRELGSPHNGLSLGHSVSMPCCLIFV